MQVILIQFGLRQQSVTGENSRRRVLVDWEPGDEHIASSDEDTGQVQRYSFPTVEYIYIAFNDR